MDVVEECFLREGALHVRAVQARGMTFQQQKWKVNIL